MLRQLRSLTVSYMHLGHAVRLAAAGLIVLLAAVFMSACVPESYAAEIPSRHPGTGGRAAVSASVSGTLPGPAEPAAPEPRTSGSGGKFSAADKYTASGLDDEDAAAETDGIDYTVCSWFPTDKPKKDGRRMLVVYKGSQSVVSYLAVDGEWTVERIMICSTGRATPTGNYDLKQERYEYHELFDANGQYCTRIIPHYLVHSLPYDVNATKMSRSHDRMETGEYELLGTAASKGCIRLLSIDAKWVYDNCKEGTPIKLVKGSGPEPPAPPALIYAEPYMTDDGFGWDPTDPDEANPYAEVYGRFE